MRRSFIIFIAFIALSAISYGQYHLDFNGSSSYISFNETVFKDKTAFTVEMWVKPQNIGSGFKSLIGEDNCMEFGFSNGQIHAWLEGKNSGGSHRWRGVYGGSGLSSLNGTWHHIALTANSSAIRIYLDGEQVGYSSNEIVRYEPSGSVNDLRIGAYTFSSSPNYFQGSMDQIRIWKKALSADDIRTLMCQEIQSGSGGVVTGSYTNEASPGSLSWNNDLDCYYHMDWNISSFYDFHYPYLDGTLHNMSRVSETSPTPYETIGNGNWESSSTWKSGQAKPQNKWAVVDIKHNVDVNGNGFSRWLKINSGKTLKVVGNNNLSVTDKIDNSGTVSILNHGSLTQVNSGSDKNSGSGSYDVERWGKNSTSSYNVWSSPVQNANIMNTFVNVNPCDVYGFNGAIQQWKYDYPSGFSASCKGNSVTFGSTDVFPGGDGLMDEGRGYFIPGEASNYKRKFVGKVNNGDISFPIMVQPNPGGVDWIGDNWNLLGNPYPCALDVRASSPNSFMNVNSSKITGDVYFWVDDNSGGTGYNQSSDYAVYNSTGGVSANGSSTPNGYIASGQGFWVVATSTTNVTFNNAMRPTNNNNVFFKNEEKKDPKVWLNLTNDTNQFNQVLVGMVDGTTLGYDKGFDALKLDGGSKISFASVIKKEKYAIQSVPRLEINDNVGIELYVKAGFSGVHYISIDSTANMDKSYELFIWDKEKEKTHDLRKGPYSFYVEKPSEVKERLYLKMTKKDDGSTSVAENPLAKNILVYNTGEGVLIDATPSLNEMDKVQVYDLQGKLLHSFSGKAMKRTWNTAGISSGIYQILVETNAGTVSKKIFVN